MAACLCVRKSLTKEVALSKSPGVIGVCLGE